MFLAASLGVVTDVITLPGGVDYFDWDTKIADEWRLQDEWANKSINLRDALGHVSELFIMLTATFY